MDLRDVNFALYIGTLSAASKFRLDTDGDGVKAAEGESGLQVRIGNVQLHKTHLMAKGETVSVRKMKV